MNVTSCLHPVRVYNKYSHEYVHAACGKCAACLQHKAMEWTERLNQERFCWKYCVFFTLTYDNDHVPTLHVSDNGNIAYDLTHVHYHPEFGDVVIDLHELFSTIPPLRIHKSKSWIERNNNQIFYLSVGDAQRFIKRLRKNLLTLVKQHIKYDKENGIKTSLSDSDSKFRYYLVGEYGETTLRPHYHGLLYFNSEFAASHIEELISKSWQFGITDKSFVSHSNASYVANYVNCTSNLPEVLLYKRVRPFAIYSKRPFIGSLCHNSKEVQEIFFSASPDLVIFKHDKGAYANVPLWRSYQRKLYPKISRFSSFSHSDRVNLYRAYERFEKITEVPNFKLFLDYVLSRVPNTYVPSLYSDYVKELVMNDGTNYLDTSRGPLLSWYYTSMRVCEQSRSFGIPVRMYVSIIEKFYANVEKLKLKNQYEYEENLAEDNKLENAFALDREFVRTISNVELCELSSQEIDIIKSFGIDVERFYSDDSVIRETYRLPFMPDSCSEYKSFALDSEIWLKNHMKTKRKNDYLNAHPELGNILWSDD